jgi:hypothetical protein
MGVDRFPVNVIELALEFSKHRFREDPILTILGGNLPGFDGALFAEPSGRNGWGILYNESVSSKGRINFTLAHEFGHYLLHRSKYPSGLQCSSNDIARWDSAYRAAEVEANTFAANLLMPLDDFRERINSRFEVTIDQLSHCAERYQVSLLAATLRWIGFTERRAILVVSRDGYVLWAKPSARALRTGIYIRTSNATVAVPSESVAALFPKNATTRTPILHPPGVWFKEECTEVAVFSEQYDFAISLIQFTDQTNDFVLTNT